MIKTNTSNPLNIYEYLGQKPNDKKPKYETKPIDMAKMKVERIDSKTIKLVKK